MITQGEFNAMSPREKAFATYNWLKRHMVNVPRKAPSESQAADMLLRDKYVCDHSKTTWQGATTPILRCVVCGAGCGDDMAWDIPRDPSVQLRRPMKHSLLP